MRCGRGWHAATRLQMSRAVRGCFFVPTVGDLLNLSVTDSRSLFCNLHPLNVAFILSDFTLTKEYSNTAASLHPLTLWLDKTCSGWSDSFNSTCVALITGCCSTCRWWCVRTGIEMKTEAGCFKVEDRSMEQQLWCAALDVISRKSVDTQNCPDAR